MSSDTSYLYGCYTDESGNIEAVLGFKREELLYDVKNNCYIEGHVMDTDNLHQRHMVQDVGEWGNVDRVTRMFDLAMTMCKEALYPYTKTEISNHELNDVLKERSVYGIILSLPSDFSETTLHLLENLIHNYIVDYATWDWLTSTHPDKAQIWKDKAEELEREIRRSLHSRRNRMRIKLSPLP